MKKKFITLTASLISLAIPAATLAIDFTPPTGGAQIDPAQLISNIFASFVWPILFGVVVLCLLLAAVLFLTAQGEPAKIEKARLAIIWGVVGVVAILLSYSIVYIVQNATGLF